MLRFLVLAVLFAPACANATFQPVDWPSKGPSPAAEVSGEWELGVLRRAHGVVPRPSSLDAPLAFDVQVRDEWDSGILRWFTPLDENDQTFLAHLELDPARARLDLPQGPLNWSRERSESEADGWHAVYADSVHRYFLLPLLSFDAYGSLEAGTVDGQTYRRLWARYGQDEMVLWSHPDTGRLHYAEFTFRSVSGGYTGVLAFPDWAEFPSNDGWESRLLPTEILVLDDFGSEVVHRLTFEPIAPGS